MTSVSRRIAAVVAGGAVLVSGIAHAQDLTARLEWYAPDGCIQPTELERATRATLGDVVFVTEPVEDPLGVRVSGHVLPTDAGFSAHIEVVAATEVRHRELAIDGACARLSDAIVVVVALMLDEARRSDPPRVLEVQTRAELEGPAPGDGDGFDLDLALRLAARLRVDILPGISAGGGLMGVIGVGAFSVEPSLWGFLPSEQTVDGAGGRFTAWMGEVALCLRGELPPWLGLGGCAGAGVGIIDVSGSVSTRRSRRW